MSKMQAMKSNFVWTTVKGLALLGTALGFSSCGEDHEPSVKPAPKIETSEHHAKIYTTSKNTTITFDGRYNDQRTDILEKYYRMNLKVLGPNGYILETGDNNGNVLGEDGELDLIEENLISKGNSLYVDDLTKPWAVVTQADKLASLEENTLTNDKGEQTTYKKRTVDAYLFMVANDTGFPIDPQMGKPVEVAKNVDANYLEKFKDRRYGVKFNLPKSTVNSMPLVEFTP